MSAPRILKSAQQLLERQQQRQAQALADSERQVRDNEAKLAELERYRLVYLRDFDHKAHGGMQAGQARAYQTFITRIARAIQEQQELLARARAHHAEELRKWRSVARRSAALNQIVGRQERNAQQRAEKSEQAASDAHAQRLWASKGTRSGN